MLKTISSITNALGALNYKGTWNASTNTPTLADGTGAKGDYYVVSTAGTQTFGGIQLFFGLGDWIAYNGAVWQRVEGGSDGNFANVTLTSTDAGANEAPTLDLYRDSASPTAADTLAEIQFNGEDSAGNKQKYACIHGSILSPTSGSEQGQIHFETQTAGASTEKMIIGTSNLVINEIGAVFNVRIEGDTDANLFYTDATNSRIGIGTITPAQKLDVIGAVKLSSLLANTSSGAPIGSTAYLVGDTTTPAAWMAAPFTSGYSVLNIARTASNGNLIDFWNQAQNSVIGSISTDGSTITYGGVSDYRLKQDIAPISGALDAVLKLKPSTWIWKESGKQGLGFIAHELQENFPGAVAGQKDGITIRSVLVSPAIAEIKDSDGKVIQAAVDAVYEEREVPDYQQVDPSYLVAVLTAAIQELKSEFEAYKTSHP